MMDKEVLQFMISQIEKIGTQQEAILVKQTELSVEQKHLSKSVDEIKDDIASIQTVQTAHTEDIRLIRDSLNESESFQKFARGFLFNHPILSFLILLMVINVIFGSLGLPLIQIASVAALLN